MEAAVPGSGSTCLRTGSASQPRASYRILPTAMARIEDDVGNGTLGDVTYPMERGMIKDWDAMEDLWRYVFYTSLGWETGSEGQLLIAEPLLSPKIVPNTLCHHEIWDSPTRS